MQRPGTLDYSRWDALDTSSDDDEPRRTPTPPTPKQPPPPERVAAVPPPPAAAASPEVCESTDAGELFLKVLPVLLAHPALAVATFPVVDELPELPVVTKLPPALLASLRSVAAADAASRAAARLACVCVAARAAVAMLHLNDAGPTERKALRAIDRRRVADALLRGLQYHDEDGNLDDALVVAPTIVSVLDMVRTWPPPASISESPHARYAKQLLNNDLHRVVAVGNIIVGIRNALNGQTEASAKVVNADDEPGALGQAMLSGFAMLRDGVMDALDRLFDSELNLGT